MDLSEQRRHPRIRRRHPVTIGVRGRSFAAVTGDLSTSGVLVYCAEILKPGTAVTGTLDLEGTPLTFGAMVRWSRSASRSNSNETQHSMGLAFLSGPGPAYLEYFNRAAADLGLVPLPELIPIDSLPSEKKPKSNPPIARPAQPPAASPIAPPAASPIAPPAPSPIAPPAGSFVATPASSFVATPAGLVTGLIGKAEGSTKATNSKVRGASPLAPSSAALLFEKAAVQAVAGALPPGTQTLGLSLKVNLNKPPMVMIGATLEAVATLVQIAPDRTLRFQVELREGERLVASGEHQRVLVAGS